MKMTALVPRRPDGTPVHWPPSSHTSRVGRWNGTHASTAVTHSAPNRALNRKRSACVLCLAQDFDEWRFRRQLAEVFDTDPGDILLSISMTVLIRNGRVLTAVHDAANNLFNISIQRVDSMFETCEMLDANGKRHATS